ncbi:SseB family protein [Streptomyces sp. NPDC001514]
MDLGVEIAAVREGRGDPGRLLGEFRRTAVLVPVVDGGLMSGESGGIRWIYAFTDEAALARFVLARGGAGDAEHDYLSILGARLLDAVIPSLNGPTGVAVDVADEDASMMFPPVSGIVPDAVAVDLGADRVEGAR